MHDPLAAVLQTAGHNVAIASASLMWNHHAHLEAYFGVPCAGGVLYTLNLRPIPTNSRTSSIMLKTAS